jgi:hypothetical protein
MTNVQSILSELKIDGIIISQDISKYLEDITDGQMGNIQDEAKIRDIISKSGLIDKLSQKVLKKYRVLIQSGCDSC